MEVHQLSAPSEKEYSYASESELSEYNFRELAHLELDEIWYWYVQGDYEGSGDILMRKGNLWDTGGLGHCS